jgi:hypothetical protein
MFNLRMEEECILRCGRNYRKERVEASGEYACIRKECEYRTPWKNKSCSMKEDILLFDKNSNSSISECYYLNYIYDDNNTNNNKYNNNIYNDSNDDDDDDENYDTKSRCVRKEECPLDYPGVCNYSLCLLLNMKLLLFLICYYLF